MYTEKSLEEKNVVISTEWNYGGLCFFTLHICKVFEFLSEYTELNWLLINTFY